VPSAEPTTTDPADVGPSQASGNKLARGIQHRKRKSQKPHLAEELKAFERKTVWPLQPVFGWVLSRGIDHVKRISMPTFR
jgi:hypothetical protein